MKHFSPSVKFKKIVQKLQLSQRAEVGWNWASKLVIAKTTIFPLKYSEFFCLDKNINPVNTIPISFS
jgi:hypothetical protein